MEEGKQERQEEQSYKERFYSVKADVIEDIDSLLLHLKGHLKVENPSKEDFQAIRALNFHVSKLWDVVVEIYPELE